MTTTTHLPPELATEARQLLTAARDRIAKALIGDLDELGRVAAANGGRLKEFPEGTPPWVIIAALESVMPGGSICWDIARAHLTNATATRLAYAIASDASQELQEATGGAACYALVLALDVNLYEFAGEVWAQLGEVPLMAEAA